MTSKYPLPAEARGVAAGRSRLAGRRVIVVGAGQAYDPGGEAPIGNGRAISVLCAREGANLALFDLDETSLSETARLAEREGSVVTVGVGDATSEVAVGQFVGDAISTLGGIDGLVLVVGAARAGDLYSGTPEDWDWHFATNVKSHFLFIRHVMPHLGPGASIVLISSIAAYAPVHELMAYHASKAALEGVKNVAAQLAAAQQIRVNIVAPGSIDTSTARHGATISQTYRSQAALGHPAVPLHRRGTGWEVAYPTVFLLSEEASFIVGQSLVVDGGYLALRH
jgi:NAD(P)-dependent dehydrogenase (short-subunit alcohol dehydrogenase family)